MRSHILACLAITFMLTSCSGGTVTDGKWRVTVASATKKAELAVPMFCVMGFPNAPQPDETPAPTLPPTYPLPAPAGFAFLLLEIRITKAPAEESMILDSDSFVVTDDRGKRYQVLGVNLSPCLFLQPHTISEEGAIGILHGVAGMGSMGSNEGRWDCGAGCVETYQEMTADEGGWQVSVKGQVWRQTYIYLLPSDTAGLKFKFKDLPAIDLGQ